MSEHDVAFEAMGSHVRFLIGDPGEGLPPATAAAEEARAFVHEFDRSLSRFREESELCRLNADPRSTVPASELLRRAVKAGIWAAERSGGLIDPTLLREIEASGYRESRAGMAGASLSEALEHAPERRAAHPDPAGRWREFEVDDQRGDDHPAPGAPLRHRRNREGSGRGHDRQPGSAATRASSPIAAATSASAAPMRWSTPTRSSSSTH